MYKWKSKWLIAAALIGSVMNGTVEAKNDGDVLSKKECIQIWSDIISPARGLAVKQQKELWAAQKKKCESAGAFDYFMAKIELQAGEFENARASAMRAMKFPDQTLQEEAELLIADTYLFDLIRSGVASEARWADVASRYQSLVKKRPDSYGGYNGLAAVALARKDYPEVVKYANLSNEKFQTPKAYRKLAIAYMQLDQYGESVAAGTKAVEMDQNLKADRDMMLALAMSNIELGRGDAARTNLNALLSYRPELKDDPVLVKLVGHMRQLANKRER